MKTRGQIIATQARQQCNRHTPAQRAALIALSMAVIHGSTGCVVTGSFEHINPETGNTASVGLSHEFKPRQKKPAPADAKVVKPPQ